jgi:hypothetical protein
MKLWRIIKKHILSFLSKLMLGYSIRKLIKLSKKNEIFRRLIGDFKAIVKISTREGLLTRYIVFHGDGNVTFSKNKRRFEADAGIIFKTISDLFIFLRNYGDIHEGMMENRFELSGNLNILLRYQFLTNFTNPKRDMIQIE